MSANNKKTVSTATLFWRKVLGLILLFGTVGLVSCQANFSTFYPWVQ